MKPATLAALVCCFLWSSTITVFSQTSAVPQFIWVRQASGLGTNDVASGTSVAVGPTGDIYAVGGIRGTVGLSGIVLTNGTMFLAKYDVGGNLLWVQEAIAAASGVAVDGAGNAYVAGTFFDIAVFETTNLTNSGAFRTSIFVAKYTAVGALVWAKQFQGDNITECWSLTLDSMTNIFLAGGWRGTLDFGTTNISSAAHHIYVAKLNSDGTVTWVLDAAGGNDYYKAATSLVTDPAGSVFVTGLFYDITGFGTSNLVSVGQGDFFLAKYNSAGNLQWLRSAGGPNNDFSSSIARDAAGNLYLTGYFQNTAVFGSTNMTSATGGLDVFLAKYNDSGVLQWVRQIGGPFSSDQGVSVAIKSNGNVVLTGSFGETLSFGSTNLTATSFYEGFWAEYDPAGKVISVLQAQKTELGSGRSLAADAWGNTFWTGRLKASGFFGTHYLTNDTATDAFITRITVPPVLQVTRSNAFLILSWPAYSATGFILESAQAMSGLNAWSAVSNAPEILVNEHLAIVPPTSIQKFFRMRMPQ